MWTEGLTACAGLRNAEGDDEVMTIDGSQNAVLDVVRMAISPPARLAGALPSSKLR